MRALLLLVLLAILPAQALAGAWARGEGKAFLSAKAAAVPGARDGLDPTFALYGEYGLTPRLTLGASYDKLDPPLSLVKGFARWNLDLPDEGWQVALEAGAGIEFDDRGLGFDRWGFWRSQPPLVGPTYHNYATGQRITLPPDGGTVAPGFVPIETAYVADPEMPARRTLIAALHAGRGFATPLGNGWMDLRFGVDMSLDDRPLLVKLDAAAGLSVGERAFVSVEIRAARTADFHDLLAVPTLGYEIRPGLQATLGAIVDARSIAPTRLEVGSWVSF